MRATTQPKVAVALTLSPLLIQAGKVERRSGARQVRAIILLGQLLEGAVSVHALDNFIHLGLERLVSVALSLSKAAARYSK